MGLQPKLATMSHSLLQTPLAFFALVVTLVVASPAMAIEEAPFKPIETDGKFELREYAPYAVAETYVEGDFEDVGNEGFRRLVRYISGENRSAQSIAMKAPVEQANTGSQSIAMTAPVEQARAGDRWRIAFVLPSNLTLANAPQPNDERIAIKEMPPRLMASVRYSGTWSQSRYEENLAALRSYIAQKQWVATGEPVWARYNPPLMPWFMRRNEILIPVQRSGS